VGSVTGSVSLELYQDVEDGGAGGGEWYVRVLRNQEPVVVDLETGDEYMNAEKLLGLVQKYRVKDWNAECGNINSTIM